MPARENREQGGVTTAGWVLAGGESSRMGRDKALLPYRGRTLIEYVAGEVRAAAGSARLVGGAERYAFLGLPVIADDRRCGPVCGILAALLATDADWNLVLACDMPGVSSQFLGRLLLRAGREGADALVPVTPEGRLHPLCSVYHRRTAEVFREASDRGAAKLRDVLERFETRTISVAEPGLLANINTPADWDALAARG